MEYMGLAGAWKSFEGFTVSEEAILGLVVLAVAVVLILAFNWLVKK
jgi:hypothetical protein